MASAFEIFCNNEELAALLVTKHPSGETKHPLGEQSASKFSPQEIYKVNNTSASWQLLTHISLDQSTGKMEACGKWLYDGKEVKGTPVCAFPQASACSVPKFELIDWRQMATNVLTLASQTSFSAEDQ